VQRYVLIGSEDTLIADFLRGNLRSPDFPKSSVAPVSLKSLTRKAVQDFEREIILKELEARHWKRKDVARGLKISYGALLYKMRNTGIVGRKPSTRRPKGETGEPH